MLQKGFSTILVVAIVLVVIVGGMVIWQYWPEHVEQEAIVEQEPLIVDGTADWQTYRNIEDGYELKYPTSWTVGSAYDGFSLSDKQTISITNSSNPKERVYIKKESQEKVYRPPVSDDWIENMIVDGVPAKLYHDASGSGERALDIVIIDILGTSDAFSISGFYDFDENFPRPIPKIDMEKVFYKMLSTFKFID